MGSQVRSLLRPPDKHNKNNDLSEMRLPAPRHPSVRWGVTPSRLNPDALIVSTRDQYPISDLRTPGATGSGAAAVVPVSCGDQLVTYGISKKRSETRHRRHRNRRRRELAVSRHEIELFAQCNRPFACSVFTNSSAAYTARSRVMPACASNMRTISSNVIRASRTVNSTVAEIGIPGCALRCSSYRLPHAAPAPRACTAKSHLPALVHRFAACNR